MQEPVKQSAVLRQVIETALQRASDSLGKLLKVQVEQHVLDLQAVPLDALSKVVGNFISDQEGVIIVQNCVAADADGAIFLHFTVPGAHVLVSQLWGQPENPMAISSNDLMVLEEITNILLHAIISGIADLAHVRLRLSLPKVLSAAPHDHYSSWLPRSLQRQEGPLFVIKAKLTVRDQVFKGVGVFDMDWVQRVSARYVAATVEGTG